MADEQILSTESQVPGIGRRSKTHAGWSPDECGLVAESAEPEDPAPELPPVRSDGQDVQLRRRNSRASTWMP